jgi:lysophospholipase L1-like esterase
MRWPFQTIFAVFLTILSFLPATAQTVAPAAPSVVATPNATGPYRIEWEVKNRFRLFRNEADFLRHAAAMRGDGVLGAERRLARATDGRGWARDMVDNLCVDQSGRIPETCQRDGERENYLAPADHRIGVAVAGPVAPGMTCAWSFNDGEGPAREITAPCAEEVKLRVRYGAPTHTSVDIGLPDGTAQRVTSDITVRDLLIAGLGDSIAAGEGNPDRPVALDDGGFCFRRFLSGTTSEYFRPGRAGFRGSKACDQGLSSAIGNTSQDWAKLNARWWNAACHRSLYGYQLRTALALAVEQPQVAVTFLPIACSAAGIDVGFFNSLRARECPPTGSCPGTTQPQVPRLKETLALAQKGNPGRKLDAMLLTVGANDIWFSGVVGDVIMDSPTERLLFEKGGLLISIADAEKMLEKDLPANFVKLRAALKPMMGGHLANVVFTSYANPALSGGRTCAGGPGGFDVHPSFNIDPARMRRASEFVERKFLPRIRALATCESGGCKDGATERMVFVDSHQELFADHGFCARSEDDPQFDRECFSEKGDSFESNPAVAATDPMRCNFRARDFRPYAPRARWIRTANDVYFTAMTFPEGISSILQPSDLHDATWGATSAVYGGAVHPTAEGHAAMADAALPALRAVLELAGPPAVRTETLPPLPLPPSQAAQ